MTNLRTLFSRNKMFLIYGFSLAVMLLLLRTLEWRFVVMAHSMELYIGAIALLFTGLGIWLALKLAKPKIETKIETVVIEKIVEVEVQKETVSFQPDEKELNRLGISRRELEVLQLMSEGLSNREIAERLFVSLNTIKTHSSRLFEKLEVKRRTEAVALAKRLKIMQ